MREPKAAESSAYQICLHGPFSIWMKGTNDFSVVGQGAFGCVYKGVCDHTQVAIEVISPVSFTPHIFTTMTCVIVKNALQQMLEAGHSKLS